MLLLIFFTDSVQAVKVSDSMYAVSLANQIECFLALSAISVSIAASHYNSLDDQKGLPLDMTAAAINIVNKVLYFYNRFQEEENCEIVINALVLINEIRFLMDAYNFYYRVKDSLTLDEIIKSGKPIINQKIMHKKDVDVISTYILPSLNGLSALILALKKHDKLEKTVYKLVPLFASLVQLFTRFGYFKIEVDSDEDSASVSCGYSCKMKRITYTENA
jgi:hypothetical protein